MKKIIILLTAILSPLAFSQVGINTPNPQGAFHVDAGKDNATTGTPTTGQQVNDVMITSTGQVGLGTVSPSEKLTVVDSDNTHSLLGIASFLANNLTQGVGIGWNGISSIGSITNVNLNLNSKGAGNIIMQSNGTTGNVGIGVTPTAKLDINGNSTTVPIRARNIPSSENATLVQNTSLMPLQMDANGVVARQVSPIAMSSSYSVNQSFGGTNGIPLTIFNGINTATIVTFKFATNIVFGGNQTGMLYGQVSYSIKNGFRVSNDWNYSGAASTNITAVQGLGTNTLTFQGSGSVADSSLIFTYNNGIITSNRTGGAGKTYGFILYDGMKIR